MSASPPDLIAVTGANGFLGFHIVAQLLDAGHATRAIVRSPRSAERLRAVFSSANSAGLLTFAFVPDITADETVYDEALRDVTAVVHTASPIFSLTRPSADPEADFFRPAIDGALNALKAATRHPAIRRFVLTSSVVARYPADREAGPLLDRNDLSPVDRAEAGTKLTKAPDAYRASKALAEGAVWDYVKAHKPAFPVTALLPALILGPYADPEAEVNAGSNSIFVAWASSPKPLLGAKASITGATVTDVARAHVNVALAPLSHAAYNNQSFFVVERTVRILDVVQAAEQAVPQWAEAWDAETKAAVKRAAETEPDEAARGLYANTAKEDGVALGIGALEDSIAALKDLFRAVDAQRKAGEA